VISATLVGAAVERWRPGDPAPDPGPSLPEERRRKLAPADALATRVGLEVARRAGLVVPLAPQRRLAIVLAADRGPRAARTEFLAGPPPAGLASPTLFLRTAANFPAAQLAIALGCRGPCATFAAGRDALERAALWLAQGAAREAIVVGTRLGERIEAVAVLLRPDAAGAGWRVESDARGKPASDGDEISSLLPLVSPPAEPGEVSLGDGLRLRWRTSR
jgi:3-oxoacyl-(acyl-carrier-protein) synthase